MTTNSFRKLCEQVLIPMLGDLLFRHLTTVHEDLGAIARELVRVGEQLDRLSDSEHRHPRP
jgi:hypothetical protein